MCGIAGFFDPQGRLAGDGHAAAGERMADALRHRGPDDAGVWRDADAGVVLAHRRLSIIDTSPLGHQPMPSASGRYCISYNGEIYNYRELRAGLDDGGRSLRGGSDTEVLLALFERDGVSGALAATVGMFALAVWDRATRTLTLARDRMGEKPLYYGWVAGRFVFGSELKALRAHPGWQAQLNRDAIALLMRHNYIAAPHSIYREVYKLPPGCTLAVSPGLAASSASFDPHPAATADRPAPRPYWSLAESVAQSQPFAGTEEEAVAGLEELLRQSVRQQMIADVPLGALLSGGIDSSLVVALMQAQSSAPVKTFTIGFNEERFNEAVHAAEVARHLGTDHTELYVTPQEAREVIPSLPAMYDEPFSDSSQIPTYLVSRLARGQVTVALSGDGGDELFCGYDRYFVGNAVWRRIGRIPLGLRLALSHTLRHLPPSLQRLAAQLIGRTAGAHIKMGYTADQFRRLLDMLAMRSSRAMYRDLVSHWKDPEALVIGSREPATVLGTDASCPPLDSFIEQMMCLDTVSYLPDDILTKLDRASMAVSLETRIPLLDHRVVEFAWRLPLAWKLQGTETKRILRRILYKYVPRDLLERPKMGFGVPVGPWLRGPLREWAGDLLSPERLRAQGIFSADLVSQRWQEHLAGDYNWHYYLWDVLMFQAWQEQGA